MENYHVFNYLFKDNVCESMDHPKSGEIINVRIHEEADIMSELRNLPSNLNYKPLITSVYDQSNFKCGVTSTIAAAINLLHVLIDNDRYVFSKIFGINKIPKINPSRLHNYWNAKIVQKSDIFVDNIPVMIESCLIAINHRKICDEIYCPYTLENIVKQPPILADQQASLYTLNIKYNKLDNHINLIKHELYKKHPVVLGIILYSNWNDSPNGLINLPTLNDTIVGSHTILLVGYDNSKRYFIFQNSFGSKWGTDGFGFIEYEYISNTLTCGDIYSIYAN
jgi:hypothetical protein